MPFENVYGNGGLLTTVGDLLKWNANFDRPLVGDAAFADEQQTPGRFNDGRAHGYALGLSVGPYRGVREVSHSGSTAGYRAFLARYPDQRVSVAVLCNAGDANATEYAHTVADLYLGAAAAGPRAAGGRGSSQPFRPPSSEDLRAYAGRYASDEAETEFIIAPDGDGLVLKQRPAYVLPMHATGTESFSVPRIGTVIFHRDASGVNELSVKQDRVWDLRFHRVKEPPAIGAADLVRFPQQGRKEAATAEFEGVRDGASSREIGADRGGSGRLRRQHIGADAGGGAQKQVHPSR
jgi:hypothetical protein